MKLTKEQLVRYGTCTTVDELQENLQSDGIDISSDKVKTLFDSLEFIELDEAALETVSGGCSDGWSCKFCSNFGRGPHWTVQIVDRGLSFPFGDMCNSCYEKYKDKSYFAFKWVSSDNQSL